MKEKLYTIELNDAVKAGASYMEDDIRAETSRKGFCRHHTKMMYDYGNSLGNAWILKSRLEHLNQELKRQMACYRSGKSSGFLERLKKSAGSGRFGSRGLDSFGGGALLCVRAHEKDL